jgi:hypothetical protein
MYNPEYGMPYETDVNAYETDEERRKRLEREAAQRGNTEVSSTTVKSYQDGSQEQVVKTQIPAAAPVVTAPVAPQDIYNRMIQAESGGRQFNAQGGVLTSPKGALGVGQVMPATAAQPGYGVTNIFDLAQQRGMPVPSRDEAGARQLLGNEQLNREFGQNYFNAMQQRFPGQPEASVAAYNAGPGRVGQNMQANAGQLNRGQLPAETQAYIAQVLGGQQPQPQPAPPAQAQAQPQPIINDQGQTVGMETPQQMLAGAATNAPVAPVDPAQMAQMTQPVAQPAPQMFAPPEQMGPSTALMSPGGWVERFNTAKNDFGSLSSMLADPNLPPGGRMEIAATMADQMRFQKQEAEAKDKALKALESGNLRELERQDKKMGGEGSWLRYIMYGLLGSPNAQLEKDKLFPEMSATTQTFTMADGSTGYLRMAKDGTPLRGATEDGRQLTQKELIQYAQSGGTPKYKPEVSMQDVEKDGKKGRVVTTYDSRGNPKTVVESGGKTFAYDGSWKPVSIGVATEKATAQKQINLAYDPIIEAAKKGASYLAETNARFGTNFQIQGYSNGQPVVVDGNTGKPIQGQAGGQITATTTPAQLEAGQRRGEKREEIIGKTEGESAASDIKNQRFADSTYNIVAPIADLIKKSTGSGVGSAVDSLAGIIGKSTSGAQAIQQLKVLSYPILANVPRFEGPQSDYDVQIYKQAAGDFANDKLPVETRLAALQGLITLLKKYDKEGKNDWTFGGNTPTSNTSGAAAGGQAPAPGQPGGAPVIIKREKI